MSNALDEHLGRRIPTKELAAWLGLDVDTIRKYYMRFGGIRPIPHGRILFFERNVVDALRGSNYAIKDTEERAYPLAGESATGWTDQAETLRNEE